MLIAVCHGHGDKTVRTFKKIYIESQFYITTLKCLPHFVLLVFFFFFNMGQYSDVIKTKAQIYSYSKCL